MGPLTFISMASLSSSLNLIVAAELKTIETFSINRFKSDADSPYPGRVTSPVTATIFVIAFDCCFLTTSNIYKRFALGFNIVSVRNQNPQIPDC